MSNIKRNTRKCAGSRSKVGTQTQSCGWKLMPQQLMGEWEMGIGPPDGTLGFMHYVGIADTFGKSWYP